MVEKLSSCFIAIAILASLLSCSVAASIKCKDIPANAKFFNTKTRYEEVNPYLLDDILAINTSVKPPDPTCRSVHLTAVIRHGTRFPTAENIRKIGQFTSLVKTEAGGDLSFLPELKSWRMWYKEEMDGRLVDKGRADHKHLAQRLVKTFPSLLTKDNLLDGRVQFITSSKHRCVNSTIAFQQGLKESLHIEGENFKYRVNDALMRFFDTCDRLLETVINNKSAVIEVTKFNTGPEMKRVQEKLADLLQIPYNNITHDSVVAGYYLCAYEFTILGVNSPWCKLFDRADAQVIDYSGDLEQYWKRGFGHEINSKSSCILFHDLFNRLQTAANQIKAGVSVSELVTVQVGHAETLLPLLTLLGFYKDESSLTSSSFTAHLQRSFRSSNIMPYAANLLLVLLHCPDGLRLQVRVNEKPVILPGLTDLSPLYEEVRERYDDLLQGCDQNTVCNIN